MKVFTKIFEIDPKEVERFIINLVKEGYTFNSKEEERQWWEDFHLVVRWHPDCNQFYVFTEPNLKHENKKIKYDEIVFKQFPYFRDWSAHYTFKGRDISLDEYLWHQFDHHHYNFYEIYALMTGETEIWSVNYGTKDDDIELCYTGIYKKEYINIIKTRSGKWFIKEWKDEKEKRLPAPKDLLKYVTSLIPKEVEAR